MLIRLSRHLAQDFYYLEASNYATATAKHSIVFIEQIFNVVLEIKKEKCNLWLKNEVVKNS